MEMRLLNSMHYYLSIKAIKLVVCGGLANNETMV